MPADVGRAVVRPHTEPPQETRERPEVETGASAAPGVEVSDCAANTRRASRDTHAACLYTTRVMHRRRVPPLYRFVYRTFHLLLDVDRIDAATRGARWFSHNRFNLLSFHDRDPGRGEIQRGWTAQSAGPNDQDRCLCQPLLPAHPDLAEDQLTAVPGNLRLRERHRRVLPSGYGWDNGDLIAVLDRGLIAVQKTDILFVHKHIDKSSQFP